MSWMTSCYSRMLVDNHITDDAPEFMTKFDPAEYARMMRLAGVEASMVYACCHNGNCYYPTKVGHTHANLKGCDIFGETVKALRGAGIVPVAYYTSIYHNNSAKSHPAWRLTSAKGEQHDKRYWWSCPNSDEYARFAQDQVREIAAYDVDGIFNDMTFWPRICVCDSCREKFLDATGLEIPVKIVWKDKAWLAFQRFRERSMAEFSQKITDAAKSVRKDITVTHQTSLIMGGWLHGYSLDLAAACDYTSGDFYGGKYQHVLGSKVLAAATKRMPYEFMTSRCVSLYDHTSMKSEDELTVEAATTIINGGAYFYIDAINPDGTLEEPTYQRLAKVSARLRPFRDALKKHTPEIHAETALYYSSESYVGGEAKADIMSDAPPEKPAIEELFGSSMVLTRRHVPYRVVHGRSSGFDGLKTIIVNNCAYLGEIECERLRSFVNDGGTLIASGATSLYRPDGSTSGDFALADVFGVKHTGGNAARFHYLSFLDRRWLVSSNATAPLVKETAAKALARIVNPHFDPDDEKYASIHSNPPGRQTEFAALTVNNYGKGKCVYLASPCLSMASKQEAQREFGAWLLDQFAPNGLVLETNAPPCVEISLLRSAKADAWLVGFGNYQVEQPNVPAHNLKTKVNLQGRTLKSCVRVSDGKRMDFKTVNASLEIEVPELAMVEMFELNF